MSSLRFAANESQPFLSVIVPVYNDWHKLIQCINSIAVQSQPPSFEVIVVDDGSESEPPNSLDFPNLTLVRQDHLGVSHARNRGLEVAKGELLLFVDADCVLEPNCLFELEKVFRNRPLELAFQLQIEGENSSVVGRAEWLSLRAIQSVLVDGNGCIRWLNTAGFAAARTLLISNGLRFEPSALRGQDTYLLSELLRKGHLPYLATQCIVHHCIGLGITGYLYKSFRTAFANQRTYSLIESHGVQVNATAEQRLQIFKTMMKNANSRTFGISAFLVAALRYMFGKVGLLIASGLRYSRGRTAVFVR